MRDLNRDDLETLLSEHRYWSGDDVTDEACDCGEWPKEWTKRGEPVPDWIEHVLDAAERAFPLV
jgi:hypothetical protein